jgi:hypothetical protein
LVERGLTSKNEANEEENANLHSQQVKKKMSEVVIAHAIVDPWTMAAGN